MKKLDDKIAELSSIAGSIIESWKRSIAFLVESGSNLHVLPEYNYLAKRMSTSLLTSDYYSFVRDTLSVYDNIAEQTLMDIEDAGITPYETNVDPHRLTAIKELDRELLLGIAEEHALYTAATVVRNRINGLTKEQITSFVPGMTEKLKARLYRVIHTGIYTTHRFVTAEYFGTPGRLFRYDGPKDRQTRSFCEKHIGETKTIAEWDAISNDAVQLKPTHIYLGGIGCRHVLTPIK